MSDASINILPLGAIIQAVKVKDINIVHGFPTQELYEKHNSPYYGETIGRVANRIKNATIDNLNGKVYNLAANSGTNTLHGGESGWGKQIWQGPTPVGVRKVPGLDNLDGGESVQYALLSKDGDQGFPGSVEVKVTYTSGTQQVDGKQTTVLAMEYEAVLLDGAEETPVNITNHSYFNLTNEATFDGTQVSLGTNQYVPIDSNGIPTSNPVSYPGTDTTKTFTLGAAEPRFDNCFTPVTDAASVPIDTRNEPLRCNMKAYHPATGIHLEVLSTEPGFQFYTGDFTNVPAIGGQPERGSRSSFCCEPGRWVNAVNVPEWRGMTVLSKGDTYGSRIVYRTWAD